MKGSGQSIEEVQAANVALQRRVTAVEGQLQQQEERFRQLAESTNQVFTLRDVHRREITYVSPAYEILYGRSCESLYADPASFLDAVHPDDRAWVEAALEHYFQQGWFDEEYRIIRPDGTLRWVWARVFPIRNDEGQVYRLVGIVEDITRRKEVEAALQESNRRTFNILESITDAFFALDFNFNFTYVNQRAAMLLRREPSELLGRNVWEEFPEAISLIFHEQYHCAMEQRVTVQFEAFFPPLDTWVEVHAYPSEDGLSVYFQDVTERKENEAALRASEESYRLLSENSRDLICLHDVDGTYRYVSHSVKEVLGYDVDELLGTLPYHLFHSDDQERIARESHERAQAGELENKIEYRIRRKDGSYIWFETHTRPIFNVDGQVVQLQTSSRDVTDRKQAADALRASQQSLQAILDASPDLITYFSLDGQLQWASPNLLDIFGYVSEEAASWFGINRMHPDDQPEVIARLHALLNGERTAEQYRYRVYTADGSVLVLESHARVMTDAQGGPLGLVSISRDVTRQVELETNLQQAHTKLEQRVDERTAELVQSNRLLLQEIAGRARIETELEEHRASLARKVQEQTADLRLANMELARSARLKDEFLANMSHELRTPLNAVLGLSEALQEEVYGPLTPQQRLSLQSIYESGQHLLTMINDVLDLAKVGAGTIDLEIDITDVEAVCQASLRMVQHIAHKKRLSVSEHIDGQVALLLADQRRLKQILVNLLSNAVKFTPEGGRIGLMVTGDQSGQIVYFEVWDTGIGITPEHQERLFQPFSQIDSSLARQYEGTGLGLALVARLTGMHGGSVRLESAEGQGSRFIVSLPWHVPVLDGPATPGPAHLAAAADTADRPAPAIQLPADITKALVIEDSTAAAEQVARYLRELHIEVTLLERGTEAVSRTIRLKPDMILLDLLLPDVQGWEVLAALRANPDTCAIPVIITSVMDDEARGFGLGASAYLVKPISREQLHAAILRIFATEESSDQPAQALDAMPLVLLVEDNEANVVMLSEYLPSRGYRVMAATSGEEAIAYTSTYQPDIILMDVQMPGMDGLEATRHIRALPAQATTPIVAVTALAMPGDRERCLTAGADDYLSKPINLQALLRTIERLLRRSA